eukprot:scaffold535128_cov21-Prasinocladus_malaysianus.AAC.1
MRASGSRYPLSQPLHIDGASDSDSDDHCKQAKQWPDHFGWYDTLMVSSTPAIPTPHPIALIHYLLINVSGVALLSAWLQITAFIPLFNTSLNE